MTLRRSMNDALQTIDLPPEALELIQAGNPKATTPVSTVEATKHRNGSAVQTTPTQASVPLVPEVREQKGMSLAAKNGDVKDHHPKRYSANDLSAESRPRLVTLSVRVPGEIPEALLRAATDRKLQRARPFTQQEIVAEAIHQWLKQNNN